MSKLLERIQEHPIYYKGQKVLTMSMVDALHERPKGTARRTFNSNRSRFVEGEDFWEFDGTANVLRSRLIEAGFLDVRASSFVLLSEPGYLKITKPMRDDRSWDLMTKLVKCYFRVRDKARELSSPSNAEILEVIAAMERKREADSLYQQKMFSLLVSFGASAMATSRHHKPKNPNQSALPFSTGDLSIEGNHD